MPQRNHYLLRPRACRVPSRVHGRHRRRSRFDRIYSTASSSSSRLSTADARVSCAGGRSNNPSRQAGNRVAILARRRGGCHRCGESPDNGRWARSNVVAAVRQRRSVGSARVRNCALRRNRYKSDSAGGRDRAWRASHTRAGVLSSRRLWNARRAGYGRVGRERAPAGRERHSGRCHRTTPV